MSLWTCIAAGDPVSSSVSFHSLNHLSSWVLAARRKPFETVLPFRPKRMAKSQNGQAEGSHCRLKNTHQLLSAQRPQPKLCPIFSHTHFTQVLSVDTLELVTIKTHSVAEMGFLESPLTSQPEFTKGLS